MQGEKRERELRSLIRRGFSDPGMQDDAKLDKEDEFCSNFSHKLLEAASLWAELVRKGA